MSKLGGFVKRRNLSHNKIKKSLRTLEDLVDADLVAAQELDALQPVAQQYDISITPIMADLIDTTDISDPIRRQFVPSTEELQQTGEESLDPVGDQYHTKIKGLVHRYPDRCLLKPLGVCPVYCRFCFRRDQIGVGSESMSPSDLQNAFDYIADHPEIWEVILTGGDPLILKPEKMRKIIEGLEAIKNVEVLRIHTRIPVVAPEKISQKLLSSLKTPKALYIVLHANHPNEFTEEAIQACAKIIDAGIPMLSQSVLLKGINNDSDTLKELMRSFVRHRIKPYYLHHADMARGTKHFRTSIEEGQALMKALQGHVSGLCQPNYVLDIPGGFGKTPIGPCYIHGKSGENLIVEDYCGRRHSYKDDQ